MNDQAAEERLVETVGVLERVDDENRGSAPRNTAASPLATCRSISSVLPGLQLRQRGRDVDRDRGRADAALRADEGEHLACGDRRRRPLCHQPGDRRTRGPSLSGSVTTSVTPARMASSISAGSSRGATMITPVVGCCRLSSGSAAGRCVWSRKSRTRTSGCAAPACASAASSEPASARRGHAARPQRFVELPIGRPDEK